MKNFIANSGYFFKEAGRIIRSNLLSNIFTFLGTVLILFLLASVVTGWSISSRLVKMLEEEAEISAFFIEGMAEEEVHALTEKLGKLDGVVSTRVVSETEAYNRMQEILANDAGILELFEENPFKTYIEIRIDPGRIDPILKEVESFESIDSIRDNRGVLERINSMIEGLNVIGYLIIFAVVITTVIIISHMIRQGIYNNKDQIKTLRLLGASRMFIGFPFICVGLLITIGAGIMTLFIMALVIHHGYSAMGGTIPFIPLPPKGNLLRGISIVLMGVGIILGLAGSLFGLSSIKD
ncbi:MAG: cell division protein FtsX [Acetivibrionales bacterium]|jgi:cell division transport system permease protein